MAANDDDAIMARFVADYLALLDQRVLSIRAHLNAGNAVTAQVAMLSLESSSTMVGAHDLAQSVGTLRAALERGDQQQHYRELYQVMEREASLVPGRFSAATTD